MWMERNSSLFILQSGFILSFEYVNLASSDDEILLMRNIVTIRVAFYVAKVIIILLFFLTFFVLVQFVNEIYL